MGRNPPKAYENLRFLHSPYARTIRIMCEYYEPLSRFQEHGVGRTIVFFGSARAKPMEVASREYEEIKRMVSDLSNPTPDLIKKLKRAEYDLELARYYEDARQLARRLTEWIKTLDEGHRFIICSGGGPGIMEAANRGAAEAGGKSIGLNISLPYEQEINPYVSEEFRFQFHYFFMRKFWFVHLAAALVVFPGGFGTLDELIEVLTLTQTGKIGRHIPVLIYGRRYWDEILNFDALVRWGTIDERDLELFSFADTVEEAFNYLREEIEKHYPSEP